MFLGKKSPPKFDLVPMPTLAFWSKCVVVLLMAKSFMLEVKALL